MVFTRCFSRLSWFLKISVTLNCLVEKLHKVLVNALPRVVKFQDFRALAQYSELAQWVGLEVYFCFHLQVSVFLHRGRERVIEPLRG